MTTHLLPTEDVHLWWIRVEDSVAPALEAAALQMMSPEERQQHRRFHFAKDSRRYLVTRLLVRSVLSRYLPLAPGDCSFESGAFGRPSLVNPQPWPARLDFNLSHTDRLVVLALARARQLGVDVEDTRRYAPLEVAHNYFSPGEVLELARLPVEGRARRFWELWTFKESYIKARGRGLSIPLDRFSIMLSTENRAGLRIEDALDDDGARWQLWQLQPDDHHLIGLCVQAGHAPLQLRCLEWAGLDSAIQRVAQVKRSPLAA